jgi:hypothetical protein
MDVGILFFAILEIGGSGRIENTVHKNMLTAIFIFSLTNFQTFPDYFSCFGKYKDFSRSGSETCEIPNYSRISKLPMNPDNVHENVRIVKISIIDNDRTIL